MIESYNGKCPRCSGQLQLVEKGDFLECENSDYQCQRAEFERLWNEWEELNRNDKEKADDTIETLLARLQSLDLQRKAN